jgi:hypothetical protein
VDEVFLEETGGYIFALLLISIVLFFYLRGKSRTSKKNVKKSRKQKTSVSSNPSLSTRLLMKIFVSEVVLVLKPALKKTSLR